MFKFLFGKTRGKAAIETQRDTVARAVDELNSVLALMADKPVVSIDLNSGLITVDLPEQMPDEALALPAPNEAAEAVEETVKDAVEGEVSEKAA
ncbi:hypothetical protein Q4555_06215 [Octadecabacter sp. 1_MG-2023]|uniref:hypothetical protein n=1 Tax=unclassified Octadecabacter TaxID=196158 RepID=UPI001C0909AE|nr:MULTISPECIES: hypothetical protein [unclassified Octadecabacter]MBU2994455.1 hypothetical protein [Octadecabacter sp. B2R22]MDO6734254.1 hypothetical protein [Octadecabacter sp. 1_MG-2023]